MRYEALGIMGYPYVALSPMLLAMNMPTSALVDLAGNAFNGFALAAVALAFFVVQPIRFSVPPPAEVVTGTVAVAAQAVQPEMIDGSPLEAFLFPAGLDDFLFPDEL